MGDPVTPSLGFAASAARFIAQLNAVKDETGIIVGQVKVVANDIAEAERLYLKNRLYLSDGDRSRVEQAIKSTRLAVDRIAREVEPARKSVKKVGTVNVLERVDWILRRSGTTETYQHSLETCHRSLLDKISMLRGVRLITGDQWASSPESTSTVGDCGRDGAQDESNENGWWHKNSFTFSGSFYFLLTSRRRQRFLGLFWTGRHKLNRRSQRHCIS